MKKLILVILVTTCMVVSVLAQQPEQGEMSVQTNVRFAPLEIYLDSNEQALAAFQFELKAVTGQIKIVGVEGGEHEAFKEPPYYDPAALANDRIIIAAFNTGSNLPVGRTRIATVHLQIIGDIQPEYEINLTVAADSDGQQIDATITTKQGVEK
ncbi:MAG: hypothetical protein ACYSSL_11025 [Planctomycetota bacterium]|jgi:hypothetical protein